jgi:hypothetical protein
MKRNFRTYAGAVVLLAMAGASHSAFAVTLSVPFSDGFDGLSSQPSLNSVPPGWTVEPLGTSVDWIYGPSNSFGITCDGGSNGCVDLDGSTGQAGYMLTSGTFDLIGGQTYELSARISGNQRPTVVGGAAPDDVIFGFFGPGNLVLQSQTVTGIPSTDPFRLYSVLYTPSANVTASVFFDNLLGADFIGPILDNVNVTAVPLPAAAWLMLSGLAALGVVSRRRAGNGSQGLSA